MNIGVRAPFFTRDLTNNCATSSASGFVECGTPAAVAAWQAGTPTVNIGSGNTAPSQGPQNRVFHYNAVLPNVGLVYDLTPRTSIFANYSRGLQVPGTDNLYNSFFYPTTTPQARPRPETTDNFDVGVRYRSSQIMAQLSGWYTVFKNRTAQAYDPELDQNVFRNLGTVDKYGIDGSIAWQVIPELQVYVYGSYLWSNIRDDVLAGECTVLSANCTAVGNPIFAPTSGNRESGAARYTFGGRIQGQLGPVQIGLQAKRTGSRFVNDANLPIIQCSVAFRNVNECTGTLTTVYGARAPAYTTVDFDVRVPLGWAGLNDDTFFQLNVTNAFDKLYVGNFGGGLLNTSVPFVQIGAPRAIIGTLVVAFR